MSLIGRLINNENIKMLSRTSTWICIAIILISIILTGYFNKLMYTKDSWSQNYSANIKQVEQDLKKENNGERIASLQEDLKLLKYKQAHNIKEYAIHNFLENFSTFLLTVIVVGFAVDIIVMEFTKGTIKLLMVRTSRFKVLLSKYLSLLSLLAGIFLLMVGCYILVGIILFGSEGLTKAEVIMNNGQIIEHLFLTHWLQKILLTTVGAASYITLAFMLAVIFRNAMLVSGFTILAIVFGQMISQFLLLRGYTWIKYSLFLNSDLGSFLPGENVAYADGTLGSASLIVAVYYVLFLFIAFVIFKRRDITV